MSNLLVEIGNTALKAAWSEKMTLGKTFRYQGEKVIEFILSLTHREKPEVMVVSSVSPLSAQDIEALEKECTHLLVLDSAHREPLIGHGLPAYLSYDSKKHHTPHAFGGLAVAMLDLAKIGRLYLNKGVWDGKRIVSESWIEQSTAYSQDNEGYHFCWYNTSCIGADKPDFPGYYAMGIRGQVLFVNPYKNLIMVRLGLRDDTYAHIPYLFEQLSNIWPE